jgi:hypothetical protein
MVAEVAAIFESIEDEIKGKERGEQNGEGRLRQKKGE